MSNEREDKVYMAKIAEQAERYDGMLFVSSLLFLLCVRVSHHIHHHPPKTSLILLISMYVIRSLLT
ncbi:hypothetical protein LRAMOSA00826 [Lichtheimia ramosa]|uniref:Uncharacterized protein n=1 Tax=Lichtheimia ramosa TaxID=688394 RepID=A0A077W9Z3_9FUNG|nr:hypothetical protein LRAMOSA00826 [Lichtheimia ramosa]